MSSDTLHGEVLKPLVQDVIEKIDHPPSPTSLSTEFTDQHCSSDGRELEQTLPDGAPKTSLPPKTTGVKLERRERTGTTWGTKGHEDSRTIIDLVSKANIFATLHHLMDRDWSQMVWRNVIYICLYHLFACYGAYIFVYGPLDWKTRVWLFLCYYFSGVGVTAGMHRLWAHKSYKASFGMELFLACGATMSLQNSVYDWCRDHRAHHKYSETDADPHNSHRGIFFAHVGWLLTRKHPQVKGLEKMIDVDDLKKNKILMFQHRYYPALMLLWAFMIPTLIPVLFWDEGFWFSFCVCNLRIAAVHHATWLVNSVSHWQGPHPYDNTIWPCENLLTGVCALGEGWHNYHHAFPNDYRASDRDFGPLVFAFNFTQMFLDGSARMGWIWDRITAPTKLVDSNRIKYGDGST